MNIYDLLLHVLPPVIYVLCGLKLASKRIHDKNFWNFVETFPELNGVPKNILTAIFTFWCILLWPPMYICILIRWLKNKEKNYRD